MTIFTSFIHLANSASDVPCSAAIELTQMLKFEAVALFKLRVSKSRLESSLSVGGTSSQPIRESSDGISISKKASLGEDIK